MLRKSSEKKLLDLVIIGAGFSGLSCAYYAKQKGLSFLILEKSSKVGGVLQSEKIDGYLIEHAANTFVNSPLMFEMVSDLGLENKQSFSVMNKRFVWLNNKLYQVPLTVKSFLFSNFFSFVEKIRIVGDLFKKKSLQQDPSINDFFEYRFGKAFVTKLINPFISGVWAGDINKLSMAACFPKLNVLLSHSNSLIKGLIAQQKGKPRTNTKLNNSFVFNEGSQQLISSLQSNLLEHLHTGVQQISFDKQEDIFKVSFNNQTIWSKQVIVASPKRELGKLLENQLSLKKLDLLAKNLNSIPSVPLKLVYLGIAKEELTIPDGFGFLVPQSDQKLKANNSCQILGCLFSSSIEENRSPSNYHLLTIFVGGSHFQQVTELNDQQVVELATKGLKTIFKQSFKVSWNHVISWNSAIPQYHVGHQQIVKQCREIINDDSIHLYGNWTEGVSLSQILENSDRLINKINIKN